MSHWCVIYIPQILVWPLVYSYAKGGRWYWRDSYTYLRGASALLVSTDRAMRRPQNVERATVQGFTLFLCRQRETEKIAKREDCHQEPDVYSTCAIGKDNGYGVN